MIEIFYKNINLNGESIYVQATITSYENRRQEDGVTNMDCGQNKIVNIWNTKNVEMKEANRKNVTCNGKQTKLNRTRGR